MQVHGAAIAALSLNLYFSAMHGVAEFLLTVTPPPHAASAKAVSWVLLVVDALQSVALLWVLQESWEAQQCLHAWQTRQHVATPWWHHSREINTGFTN